MSTTLFAIGLVYGFFAFIGLEVGILMMTQPTGKDDRTWGARAILLFWAWPLVALVALGYGVRHLWRTAAWKEGW